MHFGNRLAATRNTCGLSLDELGRRPGIRRAFVGRYKREEKMPFVETAARIAEALVVLLDYLVGASPAHLADKKLLERVDQIAALPDNERSFLFRAMDSLLRDVQPSRIHSAAYILYLTHALRRQDQRYILVHQ